MNYSEALNGVVTLERLKKEHKRLGNGRQELWAIFLTHIRSLLQLKPMRLNDLAMYVCVYIELKAMLR